MAGVGKYPRSMKAYRAALKKYEDRSRTLKGQIRKQKVKLREAEVDVKEIRPELARKIGSLERRIDKMATEKIEAEIELGRERRSAETLVRKIENKMYSKDIEIDHIEESRSKVVDSLSFVKLAEFMDNNHNYNPVAVKITSEAVMIKLGKEIPQRFHSWGDTTIMRINPTAKVVEVRVQSSNDQFGRGFRVIRFLWGNIDYIEFDIGIPMKKGKVGPRWDKGPVAYFCPFNEVGSDYSSQGVYHGPSTVEDEDIHHWSKQTKWGIYKCRCGVSLVPPMSDFDDALFRAKISMDEKKVFYFKGEPNSNT